MEHKHYYIIGAVVLLLIVCGLFWYMDASYNVLGGATMTRAEKQVIKGYVDAAKADGYTPTQADKDAVLKMYRTFKKVQKNCPSVISTATTMYETESWDVDKLNREIRLCKALKPNQKEAITSELEAKAKEEGLVSGLFGIGKAIYTCKRTTGNYFSGCGKEIWIAVGVAVVSTAVSGGC